MPSDLPYTNTVNTTANEDDLDNSASAGGSPDAYWTFTPDQLGVYNIKATGFDAAIGIYVGACDTLGEIASIDVSARGESIDVTLQAGLTYTILGEGFASYSFGELTLEISGSVPKTELREAALGVARREMSRSRDDFRIEDRIDVDPGYPRAA